MANGSFGTLERLPSGKTRARYFDPFTGKRVSETFASDKAASSWLSREQVRIDDIRAGRIVAPDEQVGRAPTMNDYLDRTFIPDLETPGEYKASEVATTRSIIENHIRPRFGSMRLDAITRKLGEEFRSELQRKGLRTKTVRNIVMLLTRILRDAADRDVLASAPSFNSRASRRAARKQRRQALTQVTRAEYLDFDEYDRFVDAAERGDDKMLRAMILTAGRCGLRSGELRGLKRRALDFRTGLLTVGLNEYKGTFDLPKGGVERVVPMSTRVMDALRDISADQGDADAFVFRDGLKLFSEKAMTARLISLGVDAGLGPALAERKRINDGHRVRRIRKRAEHAAAELTHDEREIIAAYEAGEPVRFGWHILRHTFCSHLAMKGTPLRKIQEWAGHADIQTTQRYMHLSPAERNSAAELDALDAPRRPTPPVRVSELRAAVIPLGLKARARPPGSEASLLTGRHLDASLPSSEGRR